jgi:uncharacterized protein
MKKLLFAIAFVILTVSQAFCLDENGFTASGWVNDFAGIIDANSAQTLTSMIGEVNQKTGAEVAVVTIKSLEGDSLEDFSTRLFKHWGIGKKGTDNGVLILVSYEDKKIRIEVGYGLEALINDAFAGETIRDVIAPDFRDGNYGAGILAGTAAISSRIAGYYNVTLTGNYAQDNAGYGGAYRKLGLFKTVLLAIFAVFMIIMFIRHPMLFMLLFFSGRGYRGGGGYGGGFGGGFGGFGGGMSGGGGASGGW